MPPRPTTLLAALPLISGCAVSIADDLPDDDARRLVTLLERDGVTVAREAAAAGRSRVLVARADTARAFEVAARERPPPQGALIPTEREVHAGMERERARAVERALLALPGVRRATVTLALPLRDPLSSAPPEPARAVAIVEGQPTQQSVRDVVVAAVHGLAPALVEVRLSPAPPSRPAPPLALVGPFLVSAPSAGPLRATLALFLGSMAVASSLLAWSRLRRRA
ncbi:MAG: hypothetical protein IT374_04495 [Polyangiaceae bacterium]|nr:hypothetical protein [Polyangiaceae bacterium]